MKYTEFKKAVKADERLTLEEIGGQVQLTGTSHVDDKPAYTVSGTKAKDGKLEKLLTRITTALDNAEAFHKKPKKKAKKK